MEKTKGLLFSFFKFIIILTFFNSGTYASQFLDQEEDTSKATFVNPPKNLSFLVKTVIILPLPEELDGSTIFINLPNLNTISLDEKDGKTFNLEHPIDPQESSADHYTEFPYSLPHYGSPHALQPHFLIRGVIKMPIKKTKETIDTLSTSLPLEEKTYLVLGPLFHPKDTNAFNLRHDTFKDSPHAKDVSGKVIKIAIRRGRDMLGSFGFFTSIE
jgi:hypothetical protein